MRPSHLVAFFSLLLSEYCWVHWGGTDYWLLTTDYWLLTTDYWLLTHFRIKLYKLPWYTTHQPAIYLPVVCSLIWIFLSVSLCLCLQIWSNLTSNFDSLPCTARLRWVRSEQWGWLWTVRKTLTAVPYTDHQVSDFVTHFTWQPARQFSCVGNCCIISQLYSLRSPVYLRTINLSYLVLSNESFTALQYCKLAR